MKRNLSKTIYYSGGVFGAACVVGAWQVLTHMDKGGLLALVLLLVAGLSWTLSTGLFFWNVRQQLGQSSVPNRMIGVSVIMLLLATLLLFPLVLLNLLLVIVA